MGAKLDLSKGALTDSLSKEVVADALALVVTDLLAALTGVMPIFRLLFYRIFSCRLFVALIILGPI
jgi:hypothetical protein